MTHEDNHGLQTAAWRFLLLAIVLFIFEGCATTTSGSLGGNAGAIAWRIEDATVQVEPGRTTWRYLLKLRNTTGIGLQLNQLTRTATGQKVKASVTEKPIDLRIGPGDEIEGLCFDSVTALAPGDIRSYYSLKILRTYSGQDDRGNPVRIEFDVELNSSMPVRKPSLLNFAWLTVESTATRRLICETTPKETKVFDPSHHDFVYLLIGIDNVQRRVPARTRWLDPLGQEIKVITSEINAVNVSRTSSFVHVTHSLATSVMRSRPGKWKVELYLDEKPQGTYEFEVVPPGATPAPRRL